MDEALPSPEAAAQAGDSHSRVLAVDYSPDRQCAIVFLEYNPGAVRPERYEVLCEKSDEGWSSSIGGSAGGVSWKFTHEDGAGGELGVMTRWDPPRAEWDTPPPSLPFRP